MSEFRQISQAPLYEIDKEGYIQKIITKVRAFPSPMGSNNIKLIMDDGTRKPFLIDELVAETFGGKIKIEIEQEVKEKSVDELRATETIRTDGITEEILVERAKDKEKLKKESTEITHLKVSDVETKQIKVKKEKKEKVVKEVKDKKVKVSKQLKDIETKLRELRIKNEPRIYSENPIAEKIMQLDCMETIKMWKLHKIGVSNADITILVEDIHDFVVVKTIEKYKNSEMCRNRADEVKV